MNIPQNQIFGAENTDRDTTEEFLYFIYSSSTKEHADSMKSKGLKYPNLSKCLQFNQIIFSRKFKILDSDSLNLPKNHMSLQNTIILPVVINKTTVALSKNQLINFYLFFFD